MDHPDIGLFNGDYIAIDLTENNRHLYPGKDVDFGWGVCRHGYGLQNFGRLTEEQAREIARVLQALVNSTARRLPT